MLTDDQRRQLVDLARQSVVARVSGDGPTPRDSLVLPPASGVFVTLKLRGRLRGCLGTLDSLDDLAADVARCAADAASADPRFPPVTENELADMTVEISVLTPLEPIDPAIAGPLASVTVGVHGLVIELGPRRGLLLPQVAAERAWGPEEFLRQTCIKAGLAPEAWERGDAVVHRFTAEVFGE